MKIHLDLDEELNIVVDDSRDFTFKGFRNTEGTLVGELE